MAGWAKAWKDQKPKTLLKDELGGALAALDDALGKLTASPGTDSIARLAGAFKAAEAAAHKQEGALNKTLHKDSIKWMDKLSKALKADHAIVTSLQKEFVAFLAEAQQRRKTAASMLRVAAQSPGLTTMETAKKALQEFGAWQNAHMATLSNNAELTNIVQQTSSAPLLLDDTVKLIRRKPTDGDPAALAKWQAEVKGALAKIVDHAKKLEAPGGYVPATKAVGMGAVKL